MLLNSFRISSKDLMHTAENISLFGTFIKRKRHNSRGGAATANVDLHALARHSQGRFNVSQTNILVECGTRRAAGQSPDLPLAIVNGVATASNAALDQLYANQLTPDALCLELCQGIMADKISPGQLDGPAQASLQRIRLLS